MISTPDSTPYPWPYDGHVEPARLALVVCGAGETWSLRTPLDGPAEANIAAIRCAMRMLDVPCLLVGHDAPTRAAVGLPETPSPTLEPLEADVVVHAAGTDAFYGSRLHTFLRRSGRTHLLLVGRGLETAVHSTLRRGNDMGYECLVVADACAAVDPSLRPASISSIEMSGGIFGAVGTTESLLSAIRPLLPEDPR